MQPRELWLRRAASYTLNSPALTKHFQGDFLVAETQRVKDWYMEASKLEHFKQLLLAELRRHAQNVSDDQAAALDAAGDDAKESADFALRDGIEEMALKLGDQESQMVSDIDQALLRIEEGSYGICVRCGKPIEERRLEAMPTARYDAECQGATEQAKGMKAPTL